MKSSATLVVLIFVLAALIPNHASAAMPIAGTKHDMTSIAGGDVCRYCHAGAHGWLPGGIPGMGRALKSITKVYSSASMKHKIDINTVNKSDAAFCISCHDGAGVTVADMTHPVLSTSRSNLTTDLSDDHPVGFVFDKTLNPTLKDPTFARIKFGPSRKEMWCSTCHQAHDATYPPFLVTSNDGSKLCFDCHIK